MVVGACQRFQFFRQNTWFWKNNVALSKILCGILHELINISSSYKKGQSAKANFILTTRATLTKKATKTNDKDSVSTEWRN